MIIQPPIEAMEADTHFATRNAIYAVVLAPPEAKYLLKFCRL